MVSHRVTRRSAAATDVASAANSWSAPTQAIVEPMLRPYLRDGETMPDVGLFQKLLGRLVDDQGKKLVEGDDTLDRHVVRAHLLRARRNQESEHLRELLRTARFYLDRIRGRGAGAEYGLGHGLSRMAPANLARVAHQIVRVLLLEKPRPGAIVDGMTDAAELSRSIDEQAARLQKTLAELRPEVHGANFARGLQKKGLEDTEKAVRRSAGLLAEIYKFCDHPLLARKVRQRFGKRRRGQACSVENSSPDALAAPAAEPGILEGLDWNEVRGVAPAEGGARTVGEFRRQFRVTRHHRPLESEPPAEP